MCDPISAGIALLTVAGTRAESERVERRANRAAEAAQAKEDERERKRRLGLFDPSLAATAAGERLAARTAASNQGGRDEFSPVNV